jgi:hypothetical protein
MQAATAMPSRAGAYLSDFADHFCFLRLYEIIKNVAILARARVLLRESSKIETNRLFLWTRKNHYFDYFRLFYSPHARVLGRKSLK